MWRIGSLSHFSFSSRRIREFLSYDVRRPEAWRSYRHFEGPCCFHLQDSRISCAEKDVKGTGHEGKAEALSDPVWAIVPYVERSESIFVTMWTECMWLRIASCNGYSVLSFYRHKRLFPYRIDRNLMNFFSPWGRLYINNKGCWIILHITVREVATPTICDSSILLSCCTKCVFSALQTAVVNVSSAYFIWFETSSPFYDEGQTLSAGFLLNWIITVPISTNFLEV
jgi:hypothetical protein